MSELLLAEYFGMTQTQEKLLLQLELSLNTCLYEQLYL
jgi:hypothetical protein